MCQRVSCATTPPARSIIQNARTRDAYHAPASFHRATRMLRPRLSLTSVLSLAPQHRTPSHITRCGASERARARPRLQLPTTTAYGVAPPLWRHTARASSTLYTPPPPPHARRRVAPAPARARGWRARGLPPRAPAPRPALSPRSHPPPPHRRDAHAYARAPAPAPARAESLRRTLRRRSRPRQSPHARPCCLPSWRGSPPPSRCRSAWARRRT